jgi:hypothetical protein
MTFFRLPAFPKKKARDVCREWARCDSTKSRFFSAHGPTLVCIIFLPDVCSRFILTFRDREPYRKVADGPAGGRRGPGDGMGSRGDTVQHWRVAVDSPVDISRQLKWSAKRARHRQAILSTLKWSAKRARHRQASARTSAVAVNVACRHRRARLTDRSGGSEGVDQPFAGLRDARQACSRASEMATAVATPDPGRVDVGYWSLS